MVHTLMSQVVNLEQLAGIDPPALRQEPEVPGDEPLALPGKSETEAISETGVEESKGSSKTTFHSYHGTTEHYQSDTDYSVTEASSTSN